MGSRRHLEVNGPLKQVPVLPETLGERKALRWKSKPVMTNKLEEATRRRNLQMCLLPASRNKSCCGVQIEFHYSSAHWCQSSLFTGEVRGRQTKDPLYELNIVHGEQMLSKASFTHLSDSLSPLSESKQLRFLSFSSGLHFTPHISHNKAHGVKTGVWIIPTTIHPRRQSA